MRAAVTPGYGPPEVVRIEERPEPVPGPGEIAVRVAAAGVTAGDARLRAMAMPRGFGLMGRLMMGIRRPRRPVMGSAFAGRVAALGPGAAGFAVGDRVMGTTGMKGGAHAEVLVMPSAGPVVAIPEGLSDAEAAGFLFGGLTAAQFLIDLAHLASGERLLVNGATGSVGSAALQIARHLGARSTAVCGAGSADLARDLGAEAVIDYRAGPLRGQWDVVMDVAGTLGWEGAKALLAPGGRLLLVTSDLAGNLGAILKPRRDSRRVMAAVIAETKPAIARLLAIHAAGGYRPVIGAALPFAGIVEAQRLAGSGHNRGNVVVTMGDQVPA